MNTEQERKEFDANTLAEAAEYIERLEDRLFAAGAMEQAPCFCCGYNGPGYYQPDSHPCAKRHHKLRHGRATHWMPLPSAPSAAQQKGASNG